DLSLLRVEEEDRDLTAEAELGGVGDAERQQRGDGAVGGVAPRLEELEAGGDRLLPSRGDRALSAGRPPVLLRKEENQEERQRFHTYATTGSDDRLDQAGRRAMIRSALERQ